MPAIVRTRAHRAFVSVIVDCRKAAGLTQRELAKRCGKSQSWLAQLESGVRGVWLAEVPILAKGLNMPLRELLDRFVDLYESGKTDLPRPPTHPRIRGH